MPAPEHGRVTYFALDGLDGSLTDISGYLRSTPGLPGKTERPQTTTFGAKGHRRGVMGLRDGGPINLGGFLRRVAGSANTIHGRQVRILTDQYAFQSKLTTANLSRTVDLPETTTFDSGGGSNEGWRRRETIGLKDGNVSFQGQFDPTTGSTDERFRTYLATATAALLSIAPEGFAVGRLVDMLQGVQGEYVVGNELESIVPVTGNFDADDVIDLGVSLHDLTAETGTMNGTSVDESAQTTEGWVAHLHVTALTGSGCTIKIQDSADDSNWADLSGGAFADVTAITKERLEGAVTATVRRYVRVIISAMAASSITFVVAFSRRGYAYGTAGTYRHFCGLYGKTATSSFEHGPESNASGKRKHSGECRLSSLESSYGFNDNITFTATLMVDGAVTFGTF